MLWGEEGKRSKVVHSPGVRCGAEEEPFKHTAESTPQQDPDWDYFGATSGDVPAGDAGEVSRSDAARRRETGSAR